MSIETGLIELSKKYLAPKLIKDKFRGYVLNGRNNHYFDYVNDRRLGSPTHSAIVSNYIKLIYGLGLRDRYETPLLSRYISQIELKKIIDDYYGQGMAYAEVIKRKDGTFSRLEHIPVNILAPSLMNEENEIEYYYLSRDWSKASQNPPIKIPAFGYGGESENEIICIRDFQYGQDYFALPKFQSVLQYAELEEEISNFSINHIKKGLAFGYIINIPNSSNLTEEEKRKVKKKVLDALSGSENAGATVFNFMTGDGDEIKVEVIQQNASHKQWEALREQARDQIIVGHEVVSPLLFGINRGSGLSSTADEMDEAEEQTMRRVIRPMQQTILNAIEKVFAKYGIVTDLYFQSLSEKESDKTELSKPKLTEEDFTLDFIQKGEEFAEDEWECVHESEVDYDCEDDIITQIRSLNGDYLASTGTARPNAKSEQDNENIKIRYAYVGKTTDKSRQFCKLMTNANKVYRKEDILQMGNKAVNAGFGPRGANTYSIWLYKGGARCHHAWNRRIYVRKGFDIDIKSPLATIISTSESRRRGYKVPANENEVSIKPINMPNEGFLNPR